jgi:hypothetical protein
MDYLQTTGDRLHDLELDRIIARLRTLEAATGTTVATPAPVQSPPIVSAGVRSITPGSGTQISGDVILAAGTGITTAQSGQTITLTASASPAASVTDVAAAGVVGTSLLYARQDHAHRGVSSITGPTATAFGAVTITGAGVTQSGNTLTIAGGAAASVVPANALVISCGGTVISWATPLALTEFLAQTWHRAKHDLTNATQARLIVVFPTGVLGAVTPTYAGQYSTNSGVSWSYLDGASGPSLVQAPGLVASAWITLAAGAKADVWLRIVGLGGDGATAITVGSVYLQVK